MSVLAASCTSPSAPQQPARLILPLTDGNYWIGTSVDRAADGALLAQRKDTTLVVAQAVYGADRFLLGGRFDGVRNTAEGLALWSGEETSRWLFLPFPARAGDRIAHGFNGRHAGDSVTVLVVGTAELMSVPAGRFDCHHYLIAANFNAYEVHAWLAPDVGFVRIELRDRAGDRVELGSSTWQLESYLAR